MLLRTRNEEGLARRIGSPLLLAIYKILWTGKKKKIIWTYQGLILPWAKTDDIPVFVHAGNFTQTSFSCKTEKFSAQFFGAANWQGLCNFF
jgi:hypothetical protein